MNGENAMIRYMLINASYHSGPSFWDLGRRYIPPAEFRTWYQRIPNVPGLLRRKSPVSALTRFSHAASEAFRAWRMAWKHPEGQFGANNGGTI
jgi:hypothetical protein